MKRFSIFCLFLTVALPAMAKGGLDKKAMTYLEKAVKQDIPTKALSRAIQAAPLDQLATDRRESNVPKVFTHVLNRVPVTNQARSGRCWLFAGLNVLRPVVIKKYKLDNFEFSFNYLFFYDKLEKANLFLESMIKLAKKPVTDREVSFLLKTPCGDGGQWNMVVDLAKKYGLVPLYVMPETEQSHNTRYMNRVISRLLRKGAGTIRDAVAAGKTGHEVEKTKLNILRQVYRVLALSLGVPPTRFVWRYKTKNGKASKPVKMTPKEFYRKVVKTRLEDFVYLADAPVHPYMKSYRVRYDRDMADRPNMLFVNVPAGVMETAAKKAVMKDVPVWFGADVSKADVKKRGWLKIDAMDMGALFGVDLNMSKKDFMTYGDSIPDHAMVLVGVDIINKKVNQWLVENSWGTKYGDKGYWAMTKKWFDSFVYAVIVPKSLVPKKVLKALAEKPTVLQPWDPMYKAVNMD